MYASPAARRIAARYAWVLSLPCMQACADAEPPGDPVFLDGLFEDWSRAALIVEDEADAPAADIDVLAIHGLDDPAWLYLSLDVGREVGLQSLPGTLRLLVDADADAGTGGNLHAMDGVDLVLELSQTSDPLLVGRGSGFALLPVLEDGSTGRPLRYALGVTAAPSWAARRHELRVSRRGGDGLPELRGDLRLKAVYVVGGRTEDETAVGSYEPRTRSAVSRAPEVGPRLRKEPSSIRVAQWNVSSESFIEDPDGFARVLAAVDPDVVMLDEVTGAVTPEILERFFGQNPLASRGEWRFVLGETGGRQRTVVAAHDREVRAAESMRRIDYPDGSLDALRPDSPAGFHRLLDLEAQIGVSGTGAWVDVEGQDVLFVAVDLQSAGYAGSPRDRLRTLQARTIHEQVRSELAGERRPVVIGGDLNLVGLRDPLRVLTEGLDIDGSDLAPVDAPRLGERTYTTWRDARGLFAPGRLDFLMVPDAAVSITNAFVFTTEDLDPDTLSRLGLEPELSASLSDHLVVVADLRFDHAAG